MMPSDFQENEAIAPRSRRVNVAILAGNVLLLAAHLIWTMRGELRPTAILLRRETAMVPPESAAVPVVVPPQIAASSALATATAAALAAPPATVPADVPSDASAQSVLPAVMAANPIGAPALESTSESASAGRTAPARTNRRYCIQVGAFRRQDNAQELVERLHRSGHAGVIEVYDRGASEMWYRVQAGSFTDAGAAATALAAVQTSHGCEHAYIVCRGAMSDEDSVAASPTGDGAPPAPDRTEPPVLAAVLPSPEVHSSNEDRELAPDDDAGEGVDQPMDSFAVGGTAPIADAAEVEREYEYAQSRQRRDDLSAALDSYRRVLELDPNHHAARCRLAGVYLALGRRIEAESEMFLLREVMGDDPMFLFNAAWLDFEQRRMSQAHVALVRLLDREPDHLRGRLLLGSVFEANGDLERALLEYRHAQRLAPADPAALYPLARTLDGVGLRDEALSVYEQFLTVPIAAHPWSEVRDAVRQRVSWLRRS